MIIKSSILFLVSTLIFTSFGLPLDSFAQTPNEPLPSQIHAPDRLIVKFNPGVSESQQNSILSAQNSEVSDHLQLLDVKIISVPEQALDEVKNALSKNKSVEYAEYDVAVPPSSIPNDTSYGNQWYLPMINAPEAYDITHGNGPPIVILDSGIDMNHSDLSSKIIYPYNGLTQVAGPVDHANGCGHGTPVAGSAAAITNNANGVAGVGWDTQIIPVKITDDTATGETKCYGWSNGVLKGVEWAVSHNAKVVNLSYGFGASGSILTAAQLLQDNGGWLVISAGNDYGQITKADHPSVIFVSSTTSSDALSGFSSYGDYVDMSGPGSSILSPVDGNGYSYVSGTSFAAPITASVLNLLYSVDPTLTSSESFDILKNSAVDLGAPGWDIQFGHGRVDAGAAVSAASTSTPPNFKVAFIGDQGLTSDSESVLTIINNENVDMVLHQGDFDYSQNPNAWNNQINTFLPGVPYFGSVGNHDLENGKWPEYQQILQNRLDSTPGAVCTGDLGVNSSCHYQGLFFILSGVGTLGSGHETYIQSELAADDSIWSICSWHKNQNAMQVGGKTNEVGWGAYEACRQGGAIIATAHEHSYERTKTLTSTTNQVVDPAWTNPNEVRVAEGSTFAFVSGLGGQNIRDQERCSPTTYPYGCNGEWAHIYTSNQGAQSGALFCEFNVNGQEDKATCYFKNISGQTVDTFNITSFMGVDIPQEPPVAYDQLVSTFENLPKDIALVATDANGDPLTFSIVSSPTNGSLTGTAPDLTYTPNSDYAGSDSFTFKANDGTADSNTATVSITVNSIPTSGTLDIRVDSSNDDAEQQIASGTMDLTSTDIEVGDDPGHNEDQLGGLRFTNVVLPQGATITVAYIEFETDEVDTVSTSVTISAQDSDDTSTFTTAQNNISDRITTTSSVSWNNIPAWNTVSEKHNTPDISSLVQEVANRSGWTPGNSMAFIIDGTGSRPAESYNGESENAPLLHIEYITPQPNNPPTADAGTDQNVDEGTSVNLDGALSSDSDGTIATYAWTQTIGTIVTLTGADTDTPSFTSPLVEAGGETLTFSLIVTDDDSASSTADTVDINVSDVPEPNNPPTVETPIGDLNENEDAPNTVIDLTTHFEDIEDGAAGLTYSVFANDNTVLVGTSIAGGSLTLSCVADISGTANITIRATDSSSQTVEDTFVVTVTPVNDEPSFTTLGDQSVNQNSGFTSVPGFASFNPGATDETGQTATYIVSNDNNTLFSTQPSVSSDGTITFAPTSDGFGSAVVTISVQDDGGIANGGDDTSSDQTFTITVNQIVDVSGVDFSVTTGGNKQWTGHVTIIVSSIGDPIANANVEGTWSTGSSDNCTTVSDGTCQVSEKTRDATLIFTIDDITGTAIEYDTNRNDSVELDKNGIIGEDTTAPITTTSPSGGTYTSAQQVTLTANEEATIYYTIDGSNPNTSSTVYSNSVSISADTTLKFFAVDGAGNTEAVKTEVYFITDPGQDVDVHVGSLVGELTTRGPWNTFKVTVVVHNDSTPHATQSGVLVSGSWGDFGTDSCTTEANGTCQISVRDRTITSTTFTLSNLSGDGFAYSGNVDNISLEVTIPELNP